MRGRLSTVLVLVLGLAACPKAGPQADAGAAADAVPGPAGEQPPFVLTEDLIKAWLTYQDRLAGIGLEAWDGGALRVFDAALAQEKSTADERARRAAGLTLAQVQQIEELVAVLAASRLRWFLSGSGSRQPQTQGAPLPEDPQQRRLVEQLQREEAASFAMADERQRHGDQAIALLLKYEKPIFTAWMRLMGGRKGQP